MNNNSEFSLTEVIGDGFKYYISDVNTAIVGEIQSFNSAKMTVQAKVAIDQIIDGNQVSFPILDDIPILFPRGSSGGLTFEVKKGDGCLLVFSQANIDNWRTVGIGRPPIDDRKFDLNDAIAIVGVFPDISPMIPPAKQGTELRGSKVFVGDASTPQTSLTRQVATPNIAPATGPTGASTYTPNKSLDLVSLLIDALNNLKNAGYGLDSVASTSGKMDTISSANLDLIIADLEKLKVT